MQWDAYNWLGLSKMVPTWILIAISVTVFFLGILWSLFVAFRITIPGVINLMVDRWNDEEWLQENLGTSWKMMGKVILASLNGSAMKDIQTIQGNLPQLQDEIIQRLPAELPPTEALKALRMVAMKPGIADQLGSAMEVLAMLQNMGMITPPGNGGGMVNVPIRSGGNEW